jgi:hypothetical protein
VGTRGGARPNAGRKSNAAKLLDAQAAADSLASWFTPEYQKSKWTALLASNDESVQLKAVSYLSDRLYGKAAQSMKVEGEMEIEVTAKRVVTDL